MTFLLCAAVWFSGFLLGISGGVGLAVWLHIREAKRMRSSWRGSYPAEWDELWRD